MSTTTTICKQISLMLILAMVLLSGCSPEPKDVPPGIPETLPTPVENLTAPANVNLEDFFLLTYIKPIFFSPTDYDGQIDFSEFDDLSVTPFFEEYSERTGNTIDIYPGDFLRQYELNQMATRQFLAEPTYENALVLTLQQRKTLAAYAIDLGKFIESIDTSQEYSFLMRNGQELTKTELVQMLTELNDNMAYILAQIEIREQILNGEMGYSLPDVIRPGLGEFETFAPDNTISKSTAKELYSLYTYYADDKDETFKPSLKYSTDMFKLYKINLKCWEKDSAYVYGIDEDVYPNTLLAEKNMIAYDYENWLMWDNGFTSCTCPYSDVERLNWFLIDDMHTKISKDPIESVLEYERWFLANPTQTNLELLAVVYRAQLYDDMKAENAEDLARLWKRMHQIETKTYLYAEVMNDVDFEEHFEPFVVDGTDIEAHYQQIIATDSFYIMTFMPWSSSVWFRPDPLSFDDGKTAEERAQMLPDNNFTVEDIDDFIRAEREKIE